MTRSKRWWLYGSALFLLGLGAGLYYVYFVSTGAALRRAEAFQFRRMLVAQLGEEGVYRFFMLVFDWLGNQGSSLRGYRRARRVAQESGVEFAHALALIIREIRPARLSLLANSMDGQVVTDTFGLLYQQSDLGDAETEIEDVVLTAPDVDHQKFNSQFEREINALARQLTVYVSSNDRALLMSRIINRGRRLGESTLDTLNPDQFEEAAAVLELVDPDSKLVTLIDVTPINRMRNFHNFSLETPEFFDDLYLRLTNPDTTRSRQQYQMHMPDGRVYWVLTRGR